MPADASIAALKGRGPLDRRLFVLFPVLRAHVVRSVVLAALLAGCVLFQAEAVGRWLPKVVAGAGAGAGGVGGSGGADAALRWLVVALLGAGALRSLVRFGSEWSAGRASSAVRVHVAEQLSDLAVTMRPTSRPEVSASSTSTVATAGMDALDVWIRSYVPALAVAIVVPLAAGARILFADRWSGALLALSIPFIPIFMVLIGKLTEERNARQWATLQRLAGHFSDVLSGLPTLRLFGRADAQVANVRRIADQYRQAVMRTLRLAFLSALVLELIATLSVALVAVAVGTRLASGSMTFASALVVLLLAPECSMPLRRVGQAFHAATAGSDAADELAAALSVERTADGTFDPACAARALGPLFVERAAILDDDGSTRAPATSLRCAPGQVVVLAGPSGAGKSSLLSAIVGDLEVDSGTIRWGEPIGDWSRRARAEAMALVTQHPQVIGATVLESVLMGTRDPQASASVTRARQLLGSLGLDGLVDRPPETLSGGELQRVSIARAVCRTLDADGPEERLLLLDEPTAHLDATSAAGVIAILRDVADAGFGVLVASHDPLVIDAADHVVTVGSAIAPSSDPGHDPSAHGPRAGRVRARTTNGQAHAPRPAAPLARSADACPEPASPEPASPEAAPVRSVAASIAALRWVRQIEGPERSRLRGARALALCAEASTVGLAATAAWLIGRASQQPLFSELTLAAIGVRAFGLSKGVFRYAERLASHDAVLRVLGDVRGRVVSALGAVAPAGISDRGRGQVLASVTGDIDRLSDLELSVVNPLVAAVGTGVGAVLLATMLDLRAAVVVAALLVTGSVILPLGALALTSRTGPEAERISTRVADLVFSLVQSRGEILACGASAHWTDPVRAASARLASLEQSRARRLGAIHGLAAGLGCVGSAAVLAVLGPHSGVAARWVVALVLLPLTLGELFAPLVQSGALAAPIAASAARVREVLSLVDPVSAPKLAAGGPPAGVGVGLDAADFRWPPVAVGELAPRHRVSAAPGPVSLNLPEGSRLAISGRSGSGKSTLAAGLVRFIPAASGTYLLGGCDSTTIDGGSVRAAVTWCQQSPWFAATTLRANLQVAAPGACDERLWDALRAVSLGEWAAALSRGLDTDLGDDASAMSGGERQRLALARVWLARHRVVILDEPTAHLDRPTADAVMGELATTFDGCTLLVLGHDFAALPAGFEVRGIDELALGAASTPAGRPD